MAKRSRGGILIGLFVLLICSQQAQAESASLEQRVADLEIQVQKLQQLLDEKFADDRWRDGILWSRLRPGMSEDDVRKLLGKPARVEEAIFTTWYYHKSSKLHSHVWFDEGKLLGWEGLEPEHRPAPRLRP
jgi:hypothetical protein